MNFTEETTTVPASVEAEQAVLGIMLNYGKIPQNLTEQHFYVPVHRTLYGIIAGMRDINPVAVLEAAASAFDTREDCKSYLSRLCENNSGTAGLPQYAAIIADKYEQRETLELIKQAYDKLSSGDLSAENALQSLTEDTRKVITPRESVTVGACDIQSREVPWLIPDFIARGGLNSFQGLPDSGKSWLSLALVAAVARGGVFPDRHGNMVSVTQGRVPSHRVPSHRVLYANFDDSLEYTVKPRLMSMGLTEQDFANITFIKPDSGITFSDLRLKTVFDTVKPDLAVFDTMQHFIGKADMHRANEVNAAMCGVKTLAEKHNTAVVVIQHISKQAGSGSGGSSVNWGLGSIAINGLFRSVWTIGKLHRRQNLPRGDFLDASPYRKAILPAKTNLLAVTPPARLFDLDPERGFTWAGVDKTVTAADLIQGDSVQRERGRPDTGKTSDAREFLLDMLADGEMSCADLKREAEAVGLATRTVERVKKDIGVVSVKRNDVWYNSLPDLVVPAPYIDSEC
ncbi:hypothetical protein FACS1894133_4310 [Clostridia bacterium]|nr:hypothetical protein FACS1894133_4310 [Clostridia bacterium]